MQKNTAFFAGKPLFWIQDPHLARKGAAHKKKRKKPAVLHRTPPGIAEDQVQALSSPSVTPAARRSRSLPTLGKNTLTAQVAPWYVGIRTPALPGVWPGLFSGTRVNFYIILLRRRL